MFRTGICLNVLSLLIISTAAPAEVVSGNAYLPLGEEMVASFDYRFAVETDRKEFTKANTVGKMFVRSDGWEERGGKKYLKLITSYEGISYMKGTATIWRREEGGSVYMGAEGKGGFTETLELPADVSLGASWSYNDGELSTRTVTAKTQVRLGDGTQLQDCIEVTRTIDKNKALKGIINKNVYCRDYGAVSSLFLQPSPVGNYRTETALRSYERSK